MVTTKEKALDPLKELLTDVVARLEVLEAKAGVTTASTTTSTSVPTTGGAPSAAGGEVPSVKAYDAYVKSAVIPFCDACEDLGNDKNNNMAQVGKLVVTAWEGMRTMIVLASRSKAPSPDAELASALQPHSVICQNACKELRSLKVNDRDYDRHLKAVIEMTAALSWVFYKPPHQALPAVFVKEESLGSAEFWTNRIRKDYKTTDPKQVAFCDAVKKVITELAEYIQEFHKTGLTFNPRGVSLAEAAIRLTDEEAATADATTAAPTPKSPKQKKHPTLGNVVVAGNVAGLMGELQNRKTADGTSAATGLKHVTKDQQTWRKEFKKDAAAPVSLPSAPSLSNKASSAAASTKKKPLKGLPIFEYQDRGFKWVVENHSKESVIKEASKDGVITVDITDPKQQVYLYNCDGITVKVNGKFKSLVLDKCEQCAVVYDTLISSAEMVNCKKIQLQVNGVCPVFTIDKTTNVLVWLSKESAAVSTFTTSLSSEMNVSYPDGDDQKELPIPEQFVHKLEPNGTLSSNVSDLYH